MSKTISGIWVFKEIVTMSENQSFGEGSFDGSSNSLFESNSSQYSAIVVNDSTISYVHMEEAGHGAWQPIFETVYESSKWVNQTYRTIDFGEKDKTVSDEFYAWLEANTEQQELTIADKLKIVSDNTPKVYQSGYDKGQQEGYESGYNTGQQEGHLSAWDTFWDSIQDNGNRTTYQNFFAFTWNDEVLRPKYNIRPTNANSMFLSCQVNNIKACFDNAGIVFDTSNSTSLSYLFQSAVSTEMPKVVIPQGYDLKGTSGMYNSCKNMVSAEIEFNEGVGSYPSGMFSWSSNLKDLTVTGTIANGGLNFSSNTKLSATSITGIINALSTTTSGLTITFSKSCIAKAFPYDGMFEYGSRWYELVNSRSNWTISLV